MFSLARLPSCLTLAPCSVCLCPTCVEPSEKYLNLNTFDGVEYKQLESHQWTAKRHFVGFAFGVRGGGRNLCGGALSQRGQVSLALRKDQIKIVAKGKLIFLTCCFRSVFLTVFVLQSSCVAFVLCEFCCLFDGWLLTAFVWQSSCAANLWFST